MKTQEFKLDFKKESLVELNNNDLKDVNGGGSPLYGISLFIGWTVGLIYTEIKD